MTTFAQSTIHSKIAKFQKVDGDASYGRVVKGTMSNFGNKLFQRKVRENQSDIKREIEVLPKNKLNIARKMKNKRVINGSNKNEQIILMESSLFPAIYFKKTSMRHVLKQFSFPENCQALEESDERTPLIYQIVSNLFNEINFYIFNILIGQNFQTNSFYIFFSDSQTIPFTKCCNAPVFIELLENGSGKILCNATDCAHPSLAQFLINFDDGKKLWPNIAYFSTASQKDKQLKNKISKLILSGKYKKRNLVDMVQDTSKQIVQIFYQSKNTDYQQKNQSEDLQGGEDQQHQTPFLTAAGHKNNEEDYYEKENQEQQQNQRIEQQNKQLLDDPTEKNVEVLKMKLMYITKKQKDLNKKMYKSIVDSSKIFRSDFDLVRKIDEMMLKQRNTKGNTKFNFPRIMNQVKKNDEKQKKNTVRSHSLYSK